jgi:D-alanine-D-alanine ligase
MTVALVYNVKEEVISHSPLTTDRTTLSISHPHSQNQSTIIAPAQDFTAPHDRSNDLYAEWDTMETVNAVKTALEERHRVIMVEADELAFEKLRAIRPEFVFNMSEGLYGVSREAQIPAMLEMLRIPYLGSDPLTLAVCLDKARAKEILSYHQVPTAAFTVIHAREDVRPGCTEFPAMVKPLHEGSSKGIYNSCVVHNDAELRREALTILETYQEPVLVEEFLPGREFTVAMLGNGAKARVLPIVEIQFDALPAGVNHIYSYEAKWIWDKADNPLDIFVCPAKIDPGLRREIETICKTAFQVLNCRDWARIDVRLDSHGRANIIEINPLPGILPKIEDNSCFPKAARAAGISYNTLINTVLDIAMERCGVPAPGKLSRKLHTRPRVYQSPSIAVGEDQ